MTAAKLNAFGPIPDFCGAPVTAEQFKTALDLVKRYPRLNRTELGNTLCEWFGWERPNGKPKGQEAVQWLEKLEHQGTLTLPNRKNKGAKGQHRGRVEYSPENITTHTEQLIQRPLQVLQPIHLQQVSGTEQQAQWREQVNRYHYLGASTPFGASIRYWIIGDSADEGERHRVGCLQFSSPAWRIKARDQWIGWDEPTRKRNLQQIVCNSRFLIFPWVNVSNLASHVLSIAQRRLLVDWRTHFGITPQLIETMVDTSRFHGTCYKAANYIHVGETSGRGRQDQYSQRHGKAVKSIWLRPLSNGAVKKIREIV